MTITGRIFTVLNVLLAVVFLAYAAPIAEYRLANQKAISEQTDKINGVIKDGKREPGLLDQIDQLEQERLALKRDLSRVLDRLNRVYESGRRERMGLQSQLAVLSDDLNDAQSRQANWNGSIAKISAENDARDAEFKELESEVQQFEAAGQQLAQEISSLRQQLETAQADYKRTFEEMIKNEQAIAAELKKFPGDSVASDSLANRPETKRN